MRTFLLLALLGPLASLCLPASANGQEIKWRHDYEAARKEAEERGLPIVLEIGTQNCFWCRRLDESTLSDPVVAKTVNEKFIPLRIDADRDPKLAQDLRVDSYPTVVLAAPDGRILGQHLKGFLEAAPFHEHLQRALASVAVPDWMMRDYQHAVKAVSRNEHARAVALVKTVLEEGRGRPIQAQAEKLLRDVEAVAQTRLTRAKQMNEKGQTFEALDALAEVVRDFTGTQTAREASDLFNILSKSPELRMQQRQRRAAELLTQVRDDFRQKQFLACLDRCELLGANYGDLSEGLEGILLANEIKSNTEWVQAACENLSDRLGGLYLAMAENWLKKGQPQQAVSCLERVVRVFPGSRQAEQAQNRLLQIQAQTTRRVEFQNE